MSLYSGGWSGESKNISLERKEENCWARIFSCVREYNVQRKQGMQDSQAEKGEVRQQQRMKVTRDRAKGRMDANDSWCVSEVLAADCEKAWLHSGL